MTNLQLNNCDYTKAFDQYKGLTTVRDDFQQWCHTEVTNTPVWVTPGQWVQFLTPKCERKITQITDTHVFFSDEHKTTLSLIADKRFCRPITIIPYTLAQLEELMDRKVKLWISGNYRAILAVEKAAGSPYATIKLTNKQRISAYQLARYSETEDHEIYGTALPVHQQQTA